METKQVKYNLVIYFTTKAGHQASLGFEHEEEKPNPQGALDRIEKASAFLSSQGYTPVKASVSEHESHESNGVAEESNGEPPICPTHKKPMKHSKFANGGWYCTVKIADDDGKGKAVYCQYKVQEGK